MLHLYLTKRFEKAVLFARPRRFGKTITVTMFRDFLDISKNNLGLFDGLKIMDHPDTVAACMNRYPDIFLSLKEVFREDFEAVLRNLKIALSTVFEENLFLLESDQLSMINKSLFYRILERKGKQADTEQGLGLLCRMLRQYYGVPAFVIIDEYDVPMAKTLGLSCYYRVRDMVEHMLSYVCKTNEDVKAVMLSGCLYTVKNITYTGVNNIVPYSCWLNTSETSPDIIRGFPGKTNDVNESFEQLLTGGTIECQVNENLTYHRIYENGDNIWSVLLETGYLTKAVKEEMPLMPLRIPNRSVRAVFRQEIWNFFKDKVDNTFVRDLMNALWTVETKKAEAALNQILE